jgi:hypothetical protein
MPTQHDDTAEVRDQLPEDQHYEAEEPEETMTDCEACQYPDVCAPARRCALRADQQERHRRADVLIAAIETDLERRRADRISPLEHAARIWEHQAAGPDLSDCPHLPDLSDRPQDRPLPEPDPEP